METNEDFIPYCDPGRTGPVFADDLALKSWTDERFVSGVVVSAPWQLQPRPVSVAGSREGLEQAAIELLAAEGYEADAVEIVQAIDADLDGDGAVETITVIDTIRYVPTPDGYAMVFAVSAEADSELFAQSAIPPGYSGAPAGETWDPIAFRVGAVADLNGDGAMELVVSWRAWESSGVSIYELTDDGLAQVLDCGCGV